MTADERGSGREGFTLMEVLVAVFVSGLAFVVLAQGLAAAARGSSEAQRRTRAAFLASRKMVEFETGVGDASQASARGTFPDPDEDFYYEVSTQQGTHLQEYDLTIVVRWGDTDAETFTLHRLINTLLRPPPQ